jgi:hypothetical protein
MNGRDDFGDLGDAGRVVLKPILKTDLYERAWTAFTWLRLCSNGGLLRKLRVLLKARNFIS